MVINIKLQRYLIAFVDTEFGGQPISFPKDHLLNKTLFFLTRKPPVGWREEHFGERNCRIVIPYLQEKNPTVYFYLSEKNMIFLESRIRDLFFTKFHGFILASHASGVNSRSTIVNQFADDYRLFHVPSVIDLLEKDYQRFMIKQRVLSKRKLFFAD